MARDTMGRDLLLSVALLLLTGLLPVSSQASVAIGGHFSLTTLDGRSASEQSFAGRWQLVYFGFTLCPEACPTVLNQISVAMKDLGPLADRIQPVFITIDPERDSAERLRSYLQHFDTRIVGLRGSKAQTDDAANAFRVYFRTLPHTPGAEDYAIEHSSFLFLMKPDGSFARLLQAEGSGHPLGDELRRLVR